MDTWRAMLRGADSLLDEVVTGRRLLQLWVVRWRILKPS